MSDYFTYGHWKSQYELDPESQFGFIYLIVNKVTSQKYIGRKQFYQYRKKKRWKPYKWEVYTSSSKYLNEDIERLGKDNFEFIVLYPCYSKGSFVYLECNEQHKRDVLTAKLPCGKREYYNRSIGGIKFLPILTHKEESRRKISESQVGLTKNTSGLVEDSRSEEGRIRRSRGMKELNDTGHAHRPKGRPHEVTFRSGEKLVVHPWVTWAEENGYTVDSLIMLRRGKSKSSRKNGEPSDEDIIRFQPCVD